MYTKGFDLWTLAGEKAYVNLHIKGSYTYTRIYAMTYAYL